MTSSRRGPETPRPARLLGQAPTISPHPVEPEPQGGCRAILCHFIEDLIGKGPSRVSRKPIRGTRNFFQPSVTELILERLPATLLLVITAQVLAIVIGTVLGVVAARKPNGATSHAVTLLALFGYSAPVFWTGIMLIILFCSIIPVFPVGGMVDVRVEGSWLVRGLDVLHHLVPPMVTLASIFLALYSRLARASTLDVLGSDYVRTARAKGSEAGFLLGTDYFGRDLLAGIVHGGRVTLAIGLSAAVLTVVIGITVGALSGYYGGWVEEALMRHRLRGRRRR